MIPLKEAIQKHDIFVSGYTWQALAAQHNFCWAPEIVLFKYRHIRMYFQHFAPVYCLTNLACASSNTFNSINRNKSTAAKTSTIDWVQFLSS